MAGDFAAAPSSASRFSRSVKVGIGRKTPRARGAKGPISDFSSTEIVSGVGGAGALVVVVVVARFVVGCEESIDPTRIEIAPRLPSKSEQRQAETKLPLLRKSMRSIVPTLIPR